MNQILKARTAALALVGGCLLLSGCAGIMTGTTQMIQVQSDPQGASIQLNGMHVGKTPRLLKVQRSGEHTLMIWKEGYVAQIIETGGSLNAWFFGNILVGVIPGFFDIMSGAWMWTSPDSIMVRLKTREQVEAEAKAAAGNRLRKNQEPVEEEENPLGPLDE